MRKLTNEEFLNKLKRIHGDEYTPLEQYKSATTEIEIRHNRCGRIYKTTPDKLYVGGCIVCGYEKTKQKRRKNNEEFKNEVFALTGGEYTFLEEYVNTGTKLKVIHNECGNVYSVTPRDFLRGSRCPKSKNQRISKGVTRTHEHFMTRLGDALGEDYVLLSEYENSRTKMKVKHTACGLVYEVSPQHLLNGKRCPDCWSKIHGMSLRKPHDIFVEELGEFWHDEYELLTRYVKQSAKIKVKHKKCGLEFEVVPDSLLRGSGCPYCQESRGEKIIRKWLLKNNIPFESQIKFDDCLHVARLSYDFAIKKDDEIIALVEYQGIQHHRPVDFFGGDLIFREQVMKDEIKRTYAAAVKIPLFEINYFDDIEHELSKLIPR